jgi:hypothetical protein
MAAQVAAKPAWETVDTVLGRGYASRYEGMSAS